MPEIIVVVTTTESEAQAQAIAREAVGARLAACAQVSGPLTSTYWWEGKVQSAKEWCCTLKTTRELYTSLERCIRQIHSYDVPEILALPVLSGNEAYLQWVAGETGPPRDERKI